MLLDIKLLQYFKPYVILNKVCFTLTINYYFYSKQFLQRPMRINLSLYFELYFNYCKI